MEEPQVAITSVTITQPGPPGSAYGYLVSGTLHNPTSVGMWVISIQLTATDGRWIAPGSDTTFASFFDPRYRLSPSAGDPELPAGVTKPWEWLAFVSAGTQVAPSSVPTVEAWANIWRWNEPDYIENCRDRF